MKQVLVFRTSVTTTGDILKLKSMLDKLIEQGGRWNFDLADRENILRVETAAGLPAQVIAALGEKGHYCEELEN